MLAISAIHESYWAFKGGRRKVRFGSQEKAPVWSGTSPLTCLTAPLLSDILLSDSHCGQAPSFTVVFPWWWQIRSFALFSYFMQSCSGYSLSNIFSDCCLITKQQTSQEELIIHRQAHQGVPCTCSKVATGQDQLTQKKSGWVFTSPAQSSTHANISSVPGKSESICGDLTRLCNALKRQISTQLC